jgi:hypothetical protein
MKSDSTNVWLIATIQKDQAGTGDSGFSNASWTAKPGTVVKPTVTAGSFMTDSGSTSAPLALNDYRFGQAGVWLRFFTTPAASNNGTDLSAPRAVSYQLIRTRVGGVSSEQYSYLMFRSEVSPPNTFTSGYDLLGNANYNTSGVSADGASGNVRTPLVSRLLANNVIDFGVRIYGQVSGSVGSVAVNYPVEIFPVPRIPNGAAAQSALTSSSVPYSFAVSGATSLSAANNSGPLFYDQYLRNTVYTSYLASPKDPTGNNITNVSLNTYPVAIDVMVRILTDEGAKQIALLESGKISGDWWTIALANSNVYTRRIDIKAQAF